MDTDPDIARDGGPFNLREALVALEFHSLRAIRSGNDGLHADLTKIAEFIEAQQEEIDVLRSADGDVVRKLLASRESLSKLPS